MLSLAALAVVAVFALDREEASLENAAEARRGPEPGALTTGASRPARQPPTPWGFFRLSWRSILMRVHERMNDNRLLAVAAGVVFYGLLALFPALAALVSLYGLVADPATLHERVSALAGILPQGAIDVVGDQLSRLTAHKGSTLSLGFAVGLLLAIWSANAGAKAIIDGLNVAYGEKEKRNIVVLNLVSLAFTLGALLAALCALAGVIVAPVVLSVLGGAQGAALAVSVGRWPILLALVTLGLTILYRYGPSLTRPQWTWLFPGNVLAAVGWLAASGLFSWYIGNFGTYNATYGSLGAAIGMMTWMWISMIIVLLGAELNAEIERETQSSPSSG